MTQLHVIIDEQQHHSFTDTFRIGRDAECELVIPSGLLSRIHAKVEKQGANWVVLDLNSTNGTYVDGSRVSSVDLSKTTEVQFGINGPQLKFKISNPSRAFSQKQTADNIAGRVTEPQAIPAESTKDENAESPQVNNEFRSINQYVNHYFTGNSSSPAGNRTEFIRSAYQTVQAQQKKKFAGIIIAISILSILALGFGLYQYQQKSNLEALAVTFFNANKQLDLQIVTLKTSIEELGINLDEQFELLEKQRAQNTRAYEGYIKELGIYRQLTPEEQAIYDVARIFNESEFDMPASFVGEVLETINTFWLASHRERYINAIERAEQQGFTPYIVETLTDRGLPPEFFYLALQESDLRVDPSGPPTRWGIAKGMWQFIPSTATRFGLKVGPRVNQRAFDPQDERHDFRKSTDAAARYLQEIYGTLAQSSGLLVMASYNWGEHRVANKLTDLQDGGPLNQDLFEGIPEDPVQRNYWLFLTEYEDRMPEETKDYVLKIFAAAVIGHNPRLWGIDMDNPLQKHIENDI